MKQLSIILSFLFFWSISFSQSVVQRSSTAITEQDGRLSAQLNMFIPKYLDTVQASISTNIGIDTCGAIIYTYTNDSYWLRACFPSKHWVKILKTGDIAATAWGTITGTLSNQTDLQNALNLKLNISDTTNKWVQNVYQRNDSLFKFKNNIETFIHTFSPPITANNALTETSNNIQLGGALIQPTNITSATGANRIIYSGVSSFGDGAQLDVTTTGSAGIAVRGSTLDGRGFLGVATTGVGVYGTATGSGGYGLFGLSTLGNAIYGRADSGIIWEGAMVPHSNNTIIPARSTTRASQALGANGIGYSDDSYLETSTGSNRLSNQIIYKLTNATDASYASSFEFWNANNATLQKSMTITGNGQQILNQYTGTNFQTIDTSLNSLVVDGSGNIFKRTGSGSAYTAGNGISISNNVINQLFIPFKPTSPIVGDSYSMGCCPDGTFKPWWDTLSTSFLQGVSVNNLSISGIGVRKGAYQLFNNFDESHANIPIGFFIGFNNTRVLAVDTATHYATIQAAYRSMVAAQFLNHIEAPNWGASGTNANVTYSNGPATASSEDTLLNWQSRLYYFRHNTINTGANWFNKAFCNNDTITIASMIGSNLAFGTFGYYNSVGSRIKINVDGADMVTYDPSNRTYLGQAEGFTPDGIIPDAIMVTGLTNTSHKVKVIFIDNGKRGALDWFGSMCSAQESYDRPAYILSFPHLTDSGYNYSGGQTTQAILDSASATLKRNLLATFPDYAMAFVDINYPIGFYNPKDFGEVSADSIHPSSRGQYNIGKSVYVKMLKNDKLGSYNIRNVFNSNDGIEVLSKGSANINISDTAGGNPANYYIAFRSNSISGHPFLSFTDKLASVDNKFWDQFTDGAHFFWRAVNDANTAATIWMQVSRAGTAIQNVQFPAAPTILGQNTAIGSTAYTLNSSYPATLSAIGNQPLFTLRNNSSGTDQKLWDFTVGVNVLDFRMGNDAYNNSNDWLTVTRTSGFASAQAYFPGEVNFGNQTDQGAYSIQNTGGLYQNGVFVLKGLTPPPSTYNILVHSLTSDSTVYQVPSSTFATGNTLYTGDGTANDRTVTVTGSTMTFTSALTSPTPTLTVNNTSSGHGVLGSASGAGYGIYGSGFRGVYGTGTGGGTGVYGQETSGTGMHSFVTTGTSLQIDHVPTSFNDIQTAVLVNRTTSGNSGNGANGIGTSIQFAAPTTTTTNASVGGALNWYWATATNASRKGAFSLQTVTNAGSLTDKLIVSDDIQLNANTYVFKRIDNTVPYTAAILGSGTVWELGYTPTPGIYSKGSGIIIDTNNNASLGATQIPSTAPLYATGGSTYVSGFQNQGGTFLPVATITTGTTSIALTYYFIQCDASGGNITLNLPAASTAFAGSIGIKYVFYRTDNTGNTVTVNAAGGDSINGTGSFTLVGQYTTKQLQCVSTSAWAQY